MALSGDSEREFKTADLYGDQRYSDITIKYSGKKFKAHRVVLCTRCKYFERLLSENGAFKESGARVIELKDDDSAALESIQLEALARGVVRRRHKYGLMGLKKKALKLLECATIPAYPGSGMLLAFTNRAEEISGLDAMKRIQQIILSLCQYQFRKSFKDESFRAWLDCRPDLQDALYKDNIQRLLKNEIFRAQMEKDGKFALKWLDYLNN